jgi:hypothetical protein
VQAKEELNGILLHDLELKIGWGKAIVIPPIPVYTAAGVPVIKQGASIAPPGVEAMPPWVDPHAPVDIHQGRGTPFLRPFSVQNVQKEGGNVCLRRCSKVSPPFRVDVELRLLLAGQVVAAPSFRHGTGCFPDAGHRVNSLKIQNHNFSTACSETSICSCARDGQIWIYSQLFPGYAKGRHVCHFVMCRLDAP